MDNRVWWASWCHDGAVEGFRVRSNRSRCRDEARRCVRTRRRHRVEGGNKAGTMAPTPLPSLLRGMATLLTEDGSAVGE